jgi:integrase
MVTSPSLEIVRDIILSSTEEGMPNQRYQDPSIQIRKDVSRPFYYIRPYVPVITDSGLKRERKSIQLGFCSEMTKSQAKAAKERIMATVNAGRFVVQCQLPFSAVAQKFIDVRLPQLRPSSQDWYRQRIENHILPAFGNLQMCEIDRLAIETWLNDRTALGLSHKSLLGLMDALRAIYTKARDWKLFDGEFPGNGIKVGGPKSVYKKILPSKDGLLRFLAEIRSVKSLTADGARLMAMTGIITGLRISEILGLTIGDIDPVNETIEVNKCISCGRLGPPKTEESHRIRQAPVLAKMLLDYRRQFSGDGYIFSDADEMPASSHYLQGKVFRPAATRAGIYTPGFGLHRFRHLNITLRQQAGAHPFEAQKTAGHASLQTTWLYTQTDVDRERQHVTTMWNDLFGSEMGTESLGRAN